MTASRPATAEQLDLVSTWRAIALQRMPYFANILFAMRFLDAPGSGTFAVDQGWRVYIDFEAVTGYGNVWCAEALLHEAGHLFMQHSARAKDLPSLVQQGRFLSEQHAKVSNYAGDLEVNDDLVAAGCTSLAGGIAGAPGGLLPPMFSLPNNETYEHYVAALLRKMPKQPSGSGGDQSGQGQGQGQGGAQPTSASTCGSGAGGAASPAELPATDSAGGESPAIDPATADAALAAAAVAVVNHSKSRGTVPAGLVRQAQATLAPSKVPWDRLLAVLIRRWGKVRPGDIDRSYTRPDRRRSGWRVGGRKVIFPGSISPVPIVAVVRDTSGSMGQADLAAVTREVESISNKLGIRGQDLRIIDTDALAYSAVAYNGVKSLATITGGGGTDMCVGIEAAAKLSPRPVLCVVITDGYTPWPNEPVRGMHVVACIVGKETDTLVRGLPSWITPVAVEPGELR